MQKAMISPDNASIPMQDAPAVDLLAKIALLDQKANDLRAEIPYEQMNQIDDLLAELRNSLNEQTNIPNKL
ncbi:MAG: hypothetical protein ACOYVJ_11465 [Nitrospirota bacterium]